MESQLSESLAFDASLAEGLHVSSREACVPSELVASDCPSGSSALPDCSSSSGSSSVPHGLLPSGVVCVGLRSLELSAEVPALLAGSCGAWAPSGVVGSASISVGAWLLLGPRLEVR